MTHNAGVKLRKPIRIIGRFASLLFSPLVVPLMLIAGTISIPWTKVWRNKMKRREDRFAESMKRSGRAMDWAHFVRELEGENGMLIVERFSFKGPIRLWWTRDDLYKTCQYRLVDWVTMVQDPQFDPIRDWCHRKYTGATGEAMLVTPTQEQWRRTIRGDTPLSFREGIQFVEIPPPRKSQLAINPDSTR